MDDSPGLASFFNNFFSTLGSVFDEVFDELKKELPSSKVTPASTTTTEATPPAPSSNSDTTASTTTTTTTTAAATDDDDATAESTSTVHTLLIVNVDPHNKEYYQMVSSDLWRSRIAGALVKSQKDPKPRGIASVTHMNLVNFFCQLYVYYLYSPFFSFLFC